MYSWVLHNDFYQETGFCFLNLIAKWRVTEEKKQITLSNLQLLNIQCYNIVSTHIIFLLQHQRTKELFYYWICSNFKLGYLKLGGRHVYKYCLKVENHIVFTRPSIQSPKPAYFILHMGWVLIFIVLLHPNNKAFQVSHVTLDLFQYNCWKNKLYINDLILS